LAGEPGLALLDFGIVVVNMINIEEIKLNGSKRALHEAIGGKIHKLTTEINSDWSTGFGTKGLANKILLAHGHLEDLQVLLQALQQLDPSNT
jgi:hypothetical protein